MVMMSVEASPTVNNPIGGIFGIAQRRPALLEENLGIFSGGVPTFMMIVVSSCPFGDGYWNCVPVFRWPELAGPNDIIIENQLAISLDLFTTLRQTSLTKRFGTCDKGILDALVALEETPPSEYPRASWKWGKGFEEELNSLRALFHVGMCAVLEQHQDPQMWDDIIG